MSYPSDIMIELIKKDFPNLNKDVESHLVSVISNWFSAAKILLGREPDEEKVKAFVAQVKSSLHLLMVK